MRLSKLHRFIPDYSFRCFFRTALPRAIWILLLLGLSACSRTATPEENKAPGGGEDAARSVVLKRGHFSKKLRISGTVGAVQSHGIIAPRFSSQVSSSMVVTKIVRNGTKVRAGDVLVEFDSQAQLKNVLDRQAEYDNLLQQIRKKQADQASARAAEETELTGAEVDVKTARVEMRKNDVVPGYQAEINKLNLAEAETRLKQLKETANLKRESQAAELRILEIQRDRAQKLVEYAQKNIEKMTVRSPLDGLALLTPINKGTRMMDPQEGDEFRPGGGIMIIVNPSEMRVTARVNQVDIANVYVGQPAEVRLDAYPELVFPGKVERISTIGTPSTNSKRIRFFSVSILIQGRHPKLLPDLTAAVDLELETAKDVWVLPRETVVVRNGQAMVAVIENGKSKLQPVKTGSANDTEIVIESGLREGMVVARNP